MKGKNVKVAKAGPELSLENLQAIGATRAGRVLLKAMERQMQQHLDRQNAIWREQTKETEAVLRRIQLARQGGVEA